MHFLNSVINLLIWTFKKYFIRNILWKLNCYLDEVDVLYGKICRIKLKDIVDFRKHTFLTNGYIKGFNDAEDVIFMVD